MKVYILFLFCMLFCACQKEDALIDSNISKTGNKEGVQTKAEVLGVEIFLREGRLDIWVTLKSPAIGQSFEIIDKGTFRDKRKFDSSGGQRFDVAVPGPGNYKIITEYLDPVPMKIKTDIYCFYFDGQTTVQIPNW